MCLGIPGKVIEIDDNPLMKMGKVDFGGVVREICLGYVPEVEIGAYVIVHAGFAISELDEAEAHETIKLMQEVGMLGEEATPA